MKKLFVFLLLILIFGCFLHAQTTVGNALSVNFINPQTSTAAWPINKMTIGPNASESFGLANYDGNSTSTVLSSSAWNNLDINNGTGAHGTDASVYYDLPVLNDSNGNPLSVSGSFSGRLQNGTNWSSPVDNTDFKDTVYFSTYTVWNLVNMVPMVHLRDLNSYAGTYDLIVYTHSTSTSPQSVAGIISVELDEVKDNIDHNGDGTIGNIDTNGDGEIQILEGEVFGVQSLVSTSLDYTSGPVQPVVFTGLSANNINISAYNVGGNSDSMFMVGGFQIIPTSAPTASVDPVLTITSNEGGSTDLDGSNSYTSGSSVTVTATPDTGYRFVGWTGSVSSSDNPLTITIDSTTDLVANFEALLTVDESALIAVGWSTIDNADGYTSNDVNPADDSTPDSQIANFTGVLGTAVTTDSTNGGGKVVFPSADNIGDTSYGSKSFLESVLSASGVRLDTFSGANSQLDIKMTNNSGSDVTVAGIHFDAKLNFGAEGAEMSIAHLSNASDLLDTNPNGSAFNSRNFSNKIIPAESSAWSNYDISPGLMTDLVLADGESVAFRITLNQVNSVHCGVYLDNLGISILPIDGQSLLRVGSSSGGTVDNLGSSFKTTGESVTLTATADAGYEFISWTGSTSLDNPLTVTVDEASTIIANFQSLFDDNAVVIVGWNSFPIDSSSNVSSEAPDTVANGFSGNLGTSVYVEVTTEGGGSNTAANANSFDYTYGRAYNISDSDLGSDLSGIQLSTFGGNSKRYVDLSVTNNSSGDLLLSGIHFDIGHLFFQADPNSDEEGAVLSDKGATIKVIHLQMAQGTSPSDLQDTFNQRTIASFNLPDGSLSMFSKSMDFGDLADTTLAAGETAAFRIVLENAAGGSNNPHHVGATIDNIAITGTPAGDIYTLNVTDGLVTGGNVDLNGASKYVSGQVVNLTATPAEGYIFTGWTGDVESMDATITVTMSSDLNVSPQFALADLPALAIASDAGSITISWEGSASLGLSSSENLSGTFEAVSGSVETNGNSHSYTETIQGTQKFFRLGTE